MIDDTNSINILNHTIMSTKSFLHEVMSLAWQFVRKNGFTMSEALKCAWANMKLKLQMKSKIVKFYFQKVDGSVREAYGTLNEKLMPAGKSSVSCPLKPSDSAPLKHSTMPP